MEVCVPTVPAYDDEDDAFEPGLWMHLAEVVQWVARLDGLVEPARPFRIKRCPRPKSGSSAGRTLCRLVQTGWVNFGDSDHPEIKSASAKVRAALEEDSITVWTQDDLGRMAPVDPVRWSRETPKVSRLAIPRFKIPDITGTFLVLRKAVTDLWPERIGDDALQIRAGQTKKQYRPRELDHDEIRAMAKILRATIPKISIASVAASICADLPVNQRTGKIRDQRGIERIIAILWEGTNT